MELDREELLRVIKAASLVAIDNHAVAIFGKVWLMENHALAFNNTGMVINLPIEMPALGGVDGKLLTQLLDKSDAETVQIEITDTGKAKLLLGRSTATLGFIDPTDYVHQLAKAPEPGTLAVANFECDEFLDRIQTEGMLELGTLKHEETADFNSMVFKYTGDGQLILYTSDRLTINRTLVRPWNADGEFTRFVPLDFLRTFLKLRDVFEGGSFTIDAQHAIAAEHDTVFYTKVAHSNQPANFKYAIDRLWPNEKINTKLLVPIPERFEEVLKRAYLFVKSEKGLVTLEAIDGRLLITAIGPAGDFKESMKFAHPAQKVSLAAQQLVNSLPYVDRIYLAERNLGVALFGPKRFSRFIAGRST